MIDAHAVDHALGIEPRDHRMHGLEGLVVLHAQADELVDVEEAPPVDAVAGGAPPAEAIGAGLRQVRGRRSRSAVDVGGGLAQPGQEDLAGTVPRPSRCRSSGRSGWPGRGAARRPTRRSPVSPPCGWARCRGSGRAPRGAARRPAAQGRLAAQLGIDAGRIDDVVAVQRARARRGDRRGVEMADAQRARSRAPAPRHRRR